MKKIAILILTMFVFTGSLVAGDHNITADEIINQIKEGKEVFFANKVISGKVDFNLAMDEDQNEVDKAVSFINCVFNDELVIDKLSFEWKFHVENCLFKKNVEISNSAFLKYYKVTFIKNKFEKDFKFTNNDVSKEFIFFGCKVVGKTVFDNSKFNHEEIGDCGTTIKANLMEGGISFKGVIFRSVLIYQIMSSDCYFDGAEFIFSPSLTIRFDKLASFKDVIFSTDVDFKNVVFKGSVDFTGCKCGWNAFDPTQGE